jgi:hypothetical protein
VRHRPRLQPLEHLHFAVLVMLPIRMATWRGRIAPRDVPDRSRRAQRHRIPQTSLAEVHLTERGERVGISRIDEKCDLEPLAPACRLPAGTRRDRVRIVSVGDELDARRERHGGGVGILLVLLERSDHLVEVLAPSKASASAA